MNIDEVEKACYFILENIDDGIFTGENDHGVFRHGFTYGYTAQAEKHKAEIAELRNGLQSLYNGYVNLLETARDIITSSGRPCDEVDSMEKSDRRLISARKLLSKYKVGE